MAEEFARFRAHRRRRTRAPTLALPAFAARRAFASRASGRAVTTLAALYPKHGDYVSAVKEVTDENLEAGYIVRPDAEGTIAQAKSSIVGLGLPCGGLCQNVGPGVDSTTKLRDQTAYFHYNGARGDALLTALDDATKAIAEGDAEKSAKKARTRYASAHDRLTRYVDTVHALQTARTIPAPTAGYLVDAATSLIGQVDALIGP